MNKDITKEAHEAVLNMMGLKEDKATAPQKIRCYISSPYTAPSSGERLLNVLESCAVWDELMNLGFFPYSPLWSHWQNELFPRSYDDWMASDLVWLEPCQALLRLPGESKGADIEVKFANEHNIPVFYSIEDLVEAFK